MNVFAVVFIATAASTAQLDRSYLPPARAPTSGGSGSILQTPFRPTFQQQFGVEPSLIASRPFGSSSQPGTSFGSQPRPTFLQFKQSTFPAQQRPQIQPQVGPQFRPQFQPQVKTQIRPQIQPQVRPVYRQMQPQYQPQGFPRVTSQAQPQGFPRVTPQFGFPEGRPQVQPEGRPGIGPQTRPSIVTSQFQQDFSGGRPQVQSQGRPEILPQTGPSTGFGSGTGQFPQRKATFPSFPSVGTPQFAGASVGPGRSYLPPGRK